MSDALLPPPDWSRLVVEPDLLVPLPGGGALLVRRIPRGSFVMGARGENNDEEPQHRVVIPHDFYLGKFVVTQAEWRAVAALSPALTASPGLDPSNKVNTGERRPVTDVSWDDAVAWSEAFTPLLAGVAGLPADLVARLPTEAEWEYACRAGSETEYYNGDGEAALAEVGWFGEDWECGAHEVGEKKAPSAAGLCDMHGNVWEWCRDVYRSGTYRERLDGEVAPWADLRPDEVDVDGNRQRRVVRGGSWTSRPRVAARPVATGGVPASATGFRASASALPPVRRQAEQTKQTSRRRRRREGAGDGGRDGRSRKRPTPPEPAGWIWRASACRRRRPTA